MKLDSEEHLKVQEILFIVLSFFFVVMVFFFSYNYKIHPISEEFRYNLLRKYFSEQEIQDNNLHFVKVQTEFVVSNGFVMPQEEHNRVYPELVIPSLIYAFLCTVVTVIAFLIFDCYFLKWKIIKYYRFIWKKNRRNNSIKSDM